MRRIRLALLNRSGTPLATLPVAPWPGAPGTYQLEVPLGSVARGEYLLEIAAARGADRVRALAPFRLR